MFNLRFIFNPGSCGWFCLRSILKKRIKKRSYFNVLEMKGLLNKNGYSCICIKIAKLEDCFCECLTLLKNSKKNYHYVVLKKLNDRYVYFYDPLFVGIRKKKISWFESKWSNFCLIYTKV